MSLFARRYGNNKANCDLYIVDASVDTTTGLYYMYSPEEWLEHIKNTYGTTKWDAEDRIIKRDDIHGVGEYYERQRFWNGSSYSSYAIAAYAIVTEDSQFLFSPTEYTGPTYDSLANNSEKYMVHEDVIGSNNITYGNYGDVFKHVNFNAPYVYYDDENADKTGRTFEKQKEKIIKCFESLNDSSGYENTNAIEECFYPIDTDGANGLYGDWMDSSVRIYSEISPDASINEVYAGPYVISSFGSRANYVDMERTPFWPYTLKIFPNAVIDYNVASSQLVEPYYDLGENLFPGFTQMNNKRISGYGCFPDATYDFISMVNEETKTPFIPSKNEMMLIIKNILTAYYDKQWFDNANSKSSLYSTDTTKDIEKLLKCGTSVSMLRKPFRHVYEEKGIDRLEYLSDLSCLWEDIPAGGSSPKEFFWTSTPFSYNCNPYSNKNQMSLSLSMYVAKYTSDVDNVDSENYVKYPSGLDLNTGAYSYSYYIFDETATGYKTGKGSSSAAGSRSNTNEGKLIMCYRIPSKVEWAPESSGHPEIKRYTV